MTIINKESSVLTLIEQFGHEQVVYCYDKDSGLRAIIAIHSTVLGPSLGGTRMWKYNNDSEALTDVLRLSHGMTYKASITGLNLGGGKAVIIGDSKKDKTEALFRKFGQFVDRLGGKYITAEDVGTSTADMVHVSKETKFVTGLPENMGGGGDPSPLTAYGVYMGMKASAKFVWKDDSLEGKRVVVQGIGHVGEHLVQLLHNEKADIVITDINSENVKRISEQYKTAVINPDEVYTQKMDIYAPCALGATLNDTTIPMLQCKIVAGCANNQLEDQQIHGTQLVEKGIIYAPDFLINAGGLISVYGELNGWNKDQAVDRASKIYDTTLDILKLSEEKKIASYLAANQIAEERILQRKRDTEAVS
ncbi:MAG TPA: Glu/Leu/Phe/Val dehydrogenase [Bacteroidia bacterium]|nr:Glu/Leu/Phe/Val dehydrogenase [Bacteroidia bacterium]HNT80854.1 Glu/Leu/Phe/Val dehydrogenase [Bacteroidia bacterium]